MMETDSLKVIVRLRSQNASNVVEPYRTQLRVFSATNNTEANEDNDRLKVVEEGTKILYKVLSPATATNVSAADTHIFKCAACVPERTPQADFFRICNIGHILDHAVTTSRTRKNDNEVPTCCIMACGQTGAGKTYTMFGPGPPMGSQSVLDVAALDHDTGENEAHSGVDDGLIVRSVEYLFAMLAEHNRNHAPDAQFILKLCCIEVCDEHAFDLFSGSNTLPVTVKEHPTDGFSVQGCQLIDCTDFEVAAAALELIARHRRGRHTGSPHSKRHLADMHNGVHKVDRSHCIVEICVCLPVIVDDNANTSNISAEHTQSGPPIGRLQIVTAKDAEAVESDQALRFSILRKVTFVELAGSERMKASKSDKNAKSPDSKTKKTPKPIESTAELGFINPSIYTLGRVIAGLVRAHGSIHSTSVPYQDSLLTKLLIQALSVGYRHHSNVMIACVENSKACEMETLRTLKFATSCANIHTPAARLSNQEKLILDLKVNIKRVRQENTEMRRTILTTPSYGDKVLAHIDSGSLDASEVFAHADPKIKPQIKDVRKPVSASSGSEKKRTWTSWKIFETKSKSNNGHKTIEIKIPGLGGGSKVHPVSDSAGSVGYVDHFPSQQLPSQGTEPRQKSAHKHTDKQIEKEHRSVTDAAAMFRHTGGPDRQSTAEVQATAYEDDDQGYGSGFEDDAWQERQEKELHSAPVQPSTDNQRPATSPQLRTAPGPTTALLHENSITTMGSYTSTRSKDPSQQLVMDDLIRRRASGPMVFRGGATEVIVPVRESVRLNALASTALEMKQAEQKRALQMKKLVQEECRKRNSRGVSPYLAHFVPKKVIKERPEFVVLRPETPPIVTHDPDFYRLDGGNSGDKHAHSHGHGHGHERSVALSAQVGEANMSLDNVRHGAATPPRNRSRSRSRSRSPSHSPSKSRPVSRVGRAATRQRPHSSAASLSSPESPPHHKPRCKEVALLVPQAHTKMADLLVAEYSATSSPGGSSRALLEMNPTPLVDRIPEIHPPHKNKEDKKDSFSPRENNEPLCLAVEGKSLSPQQTRELREEPRPEEEGEEQEYEELFESDEGIEADATAADDVVADGGTIDSEAQVQADALAQPPTEPAAEDDSAAQEATAALAAETAESVAAEVARLEQERQEQREQAAAEAAADEARARQAEEELLVAQLYAASEQRKQEEQVNVFKVRSTSVDEPDYGEEFEPDDEEQGSAAHKLAVESSAARGIAELSTTDSAEAGSAKPTCDEQNEAATTSEQEAEPEEPTPHTPAVTVVPAAVSEEDAYDEEFEADFEPEIEGTEPDPLPTSATASAPVEAAETEDGGAGMEAAAIGIAAGIAAVGAAAASAVSTAVSSSLASADDQVGLEASVPACEAEDANTHQEPASTKEESATSKHSAEKMEAETPNAQHTDIESEYATEPFAMPDSSSEPAPATGADEFAPGHIQSGDGETYEEDAYEDEFEAEPEPEVDASLLAAVPAQSGPSSANPILSDHIVKLPENPDIAGSELENTLRAVPLPADEQDSSEAPVPLTMEPPVSVETDTLEVDNIASAADGSAPAVNAESAMVIAAPVVANEEDAYEDEFEQFEGENSPVFVPAIEVPAPLAADNQEVAVAEAKFAVDTEACSEAADAPATASDVKSEAHADDAEGSETASAVTVAEEGGTSAGEAEASAPGAPADDQQSAEVVDAKTTAATPPNASTAPDEWSAVESLVDAAVTTAVDHLTPIPAEVLLEPGANDIAPVDAGDHHAVAAADWMEASSLVAVAVDTAMTRLTPLPAEFSADAVEETGGAQLPTEEAAGSDATTTEEQDGNPVNADATATSTSVAEPEPIEPSTEVPVAVAAEEPGVNLDSDISTADFASETGGAIVQAALQSVSQKMSSRTSLADVTELAGAPKEETKQAEPESYKQAASVLQAEVDLLSVPAENVSVEPEAAIPVESLASPRNALVAAAEALLRVVVPEPKPQPISATPSLAPMRTGFSEHQWSSDSVSPGPDSGRMGGARALPSSLSTIMRAERQAQMDVDSDEESQKRFVAQFGAPAPTKPVTKQEPNYLKAATVNVQKTAEIKATASAGLTPKSPKASKSAMEILSTATDRAAVESAVRNAMADYTAATDAEEASLRSSIGKPSTLSSFLRAERQDEAESDNESVKTRKEAASPKPAEDSAKPDPEGDVNVDADAGAGVAPPAADHPVDFIEQDVAVSTVTYLEPAAEQTPPEESAVPPSEFAEQQTVSESVSTGEESIQPDAAVTERAEESNAAELVSAVAAVDIAGTATSTTISPPDAEQGNDEFPTKPPVDSAELQRQADGVSRPATPPPAAVAPPTFENAPEERNTATEDNDRAAPEDRPKTLPAVDLPDAAIIEEPRAAATEPEQEIQADVASAAMSVEVTAEPLSALPAPEAATTAAESVIEPTEPKEALVVELQASAPVENSQQMSPENRIAEVAATEEEPKETAGVTAEGVLESDLHPNLADQPAQTPVAAEVEVQPPDEVTLEPEPAVVLLPEEEAPATAETPSPQVDDIISNVAPVTDTSAESAPIESTVEPATEPVAADTSVVPAETSVADEPDTAAFGDTAFSVKTRKSEAASEFDYDVDFSEVGGSLKEMLTMEDLHRDPSLAALAFADSEANSVVEGDRQDATVPAMGKPPAEAVADAEGDNHSNEPVAEPDNAEGPASCKEPAPSAMSTAVDTALVPEKDYLLSDLATPNADIPEPENAENAPVDDEDLFDVDF